MDRRKGEHRERAERHAREGARLSAAGRTRIMRAPRSRMLLVGSGAPATAPSVPGKTESRLASRSRLSARRPRAGLRHVDAQLLDAPRVGLEHLELDAARMPHALAPRRNAAGKGEDEATKRVDVFFLLSRDELDAEMLSRAPRSACARRRRGQAAGPSRISGSSSTSCSSSISPTTSSTRSSIETRPSVPPYSSTTRAR